MEILRKYEASFLMWYVQVVYKNEITELAFDHDPSNEEIQKVVDNMEQQEVLDGNSE